MKDEKTQSDADSASVLNGANKKEPIWVGPNSPGTDSDSTAPQRPVSRPQINTGNGSLAFSSFVMLLLNLCIVGGFILLFGWESTMAMFGNGENPEHWKWLGGLVGLVGMLIRLFAIAIVCVPYLVIAVVGIWMAIRVYFGASERGLKLIAFVIAFCHFMMLAIPLGFIAPIFNS
jgi:hypothetical protein